MKWFLLTLIIIGGSVFWFMRSEPASQDRPLAPLIQKLKQAQKPDPEPHTGPLAGALFVPYWNIPATEPSLPTQDTDLTTLIYFGITPTESGSIRTDESGYAGLQRFSDIQSEGQRLLTIRMLDETVNRAILESSSSQETLFNEAISLARQHDFDGILLDLEHSVLPTSKTVKSITSFVEGFSQSAKAANYSFSMAIYGDAYYRPRPFDVPKLAPHVDTIYLMAYDFHKSYGEPGPNFPLYAHQAYSYSLEKMLEDFSQDVPPSKLAVLFGAYGYDWSVDDQNRPAKAATARPLSQIMDRFYPQCPFTNCTITRDPASSEMHITYTDDAGQLHSLWHEDTTSIKTKSDFVRSQGIGQIGFWVYGYY